MQPFERARAASALAIVLHALRDGAALDALLAEWLPRAPGHAALNMVHGMRQRERGDVEGALASQRRALECEPSDGTAVHVHNELGHLHHAAGRYDAAWEAFARSKALRAGTAAGRALDPARFRRELEAVLEWSATLVPEFVPSRPIDDGLAAPVFLIGFPRSGTTLVERVLGMHPTLEVSGERPILVRVLAHLGELLHSPAPLPTLFESLDAGEIGVLRQAYWDFAARECADWADDATLARLRDAGDPLTLVDKNPLLLAKLPFILKLFPDARIVTVVRDPRDAVLSCMMQSFGHSDAMANTRTVELAGPFYDLAMRCWQATGDALGARQHVLRYEVLVREPELPLRGLARYLGVEWTPRMLEYHVRDDNRVVATPSVHQVARPLYADAVGRWRHYADRLAPAMPHLAPWVERLGYAEDA